MLTIRRKWLLLSNWLCFIWNIYVICIFKKPSGSHSIKIMTDKQVLNVKMAMSGLLRFLALSMTDPVISDGRGGSGWWVVVFGRGGVQFHAHVLLSTIHVHGACTFWWNFVSDNASPNFVFIFICSPKHYYA